MRESRHIIKPVFGENLPPKDPLRNKLETSFKSSVVTRWRVANAKDSWIADFPSATGYVLDGGLLLNI